MSDSTPAPRVAPERRPIIRVLRGVAIVVARLYHRLTLRSRCRLPSAGPAIVVCNHTSGLDPVLIQSACDRLIVWMMAAEYYNLPVLHWFFKTIEVIPTTRSGRDLSAVRAAMRALHDGRVLGLFPEGRIEPTRELLPFETGVALLAIRADVSVYPAYLDGTQRNRTLAGAFLRPCHATLRFGPPLKFPAGDTSKPALDSATAQIRSAIAALDRPRRGQSGNLCRLGGADADSRGGKCSRS